MQTESPLLELIGVCKTFSSPGGGTPLAVLQDISLQLTAGESLAVVGPSGTGKSTLLHLMGTLDQPDSGTVKLQGRDLSKLSTAELARVRNREIGFVFQSHYLLPQCTVLENVLIPTLALKPSPSPADTQPRAVQLLKRLGLEDRLNHRPGQLSGGERQRVAVARALINGPRLILADEPTGALDQDSARELGRLLAEINQEEKVSLVVVTHSLELAANMQRTLRLNRGRLAPLEPAIPA